MKKVYAKQEKVAMLFVSVRLRSSSLNSFAQKKNDSVFAKIQVNLISCIVVV